MNALLVVSCLFLPAQQDGADDMHSELSRVSGPVSEVDVTTTISTITESLREADRGLAAGRTGGKTLAAQQKAIDELEKLIKAARSNTQSTDSASQSAAASEQRPAGRDTPAGQESNAQQNPQGGTASQRSGNAASSDENATAPAGSTSVVQRFRANVVSDAWGHLPQRLRDQLLNVGSDQYLPKYDGLVRDYFESLAKPGVEQQRPESQGTE